MDLSNLKNRFLFGADMLLPEFLREEDLSATIKKEIIPLLDLKDFEGMYKDGGRPPVSPIILLTVTLFQYLESLTDRAAAFNMRYRLDWKIALGLEMDYDGFHYSLLSRFRDRLISNDKSSLAFDRILEHLSERGLVKASSKQRIDSTHVVGNIRELSRLELLNETLRLFCNDTNSYKSRMDQTLVDITNKYFEKVSSYRLSPVEKDEMIECAGLAMKALIYWVINSEALSELRNKNSFQTLMLVYEQNFIDDENDDTPPKLVKIATGKDHICSPHEPESRFGNKGSKKWHGYKAQIAETVTDKDDQSEANFITYADVNDANDYDGSMVEEYISDQETKGIKPDEVYADTHYNSEANIDVLKEKSVDLKGPVMPMPTKGRTKEKNIGFQADLNKETVTCPAGSESKKFTYRAQNKISGIFDTTDCTPCKQKEICQPEPSGKVILIKVISETLAKRREEMESLEFKKDMYKRNGIEGTLSGLVRGQGMRRSRFRGKAKLRLQIKFSAASANIKRLHSRELIADAA